MGEDDEDAINKAIGDTVLEKFNTVLLVSAIASGGASAYGVDTPANIGVCISALSRWDASLRTANSRTCRRLLVTCTKQSHK